LSDPRAEILGPFLIKYFSTSFKGQINIVPGEENRREGGVPPQVYISFNHSEGEQLSA